MLDNKFKVGYACFSGARKLVEGPVVIIWNLFWVGGGKITPRYLYSLVVGS